MGSRAFKLNFSGGWNHTSFERDAMEVHRQPKCGLGNVVVCSPTQHFALQQKIQRRHICARAWSSHSVYFYVLGSTSIALSSSIFQRVLKGNC